MRMRPRIIAQARGTCGQKHCSGTLGGMSGVTALGVVSHGTGKCPSPVFPRVHPDPNTSAVHSTGSCSGMIMRLRGSVCTRGVLQMLATANAMYPAWFLRGRGWRTSNAPLPQWKRHPMPGGGAPVVRELPSYRCSGLLLESYAACWSSKPLSSQYSPKRHNTVSECMAKYTRSIYHSL